MNATLRILLVEDSPTDVVLIKDELQNGGIEFTIDQAETEAEVRAALLLKPDLVMADYSLPGFTAIDVLDWFKQSGSDAPFILVSGTIDTETAVASMRKGATDYILKSNLPALPGAVHRAIEALTLRRAKRSADQKVSFLAHMLDLAQDAIIVCDFDRSRIQYWNKGAQKLYGWTAGEVMGRDVNEFLTPSEDQTCQMIKNLLRDGEWNCEVYRQRRTGQEIAVSERATLARDAEGKPSAILFIYHDITERKQAEEQIHYQEALIRETGEIAQLGSWEFSVLTGHLYWTPEVLRIFGLPPTHSASLELGLSFFRGEGRPVVETALKAAVDQAIPYDLELDITAADGIVKRVRNVGHPVVEKGKVVRVRGVLQDITVQKRAENQLRDQAQLLDLTTDAILVSDFTTGQILYWNQGAERMHGWTAEEAIGEQAADLLLLDEQAGPNILRTVGESGEWSGELHERTKAGGEIIVSSRVTLVRNESGQPKSLLSIHTDVTERKLLESQFLRAQRLESVGTLASGIAHDLNNILAPIIMAGPLLDGDLAPELRKAIVQTINTSARRGVEIVRQVLTFARGTKVQQRPVNCEQLIMEITSIAGETFPKSISIAAKAKPGLWTALGDSTQLQQILLNLAINARDAMPEGGTLSISARNFVVDASFASMTPEAKVGPYVLLQVADTGTGISKAIIDKIFDPFFSTKEVGKGTGLGLSTVLGIVKSHNGFLSVESEPHRGTTFKVFIPASAACGLDEGAEPEIAPPPQGTGEVVLLVEDEPNIRTVSEVLLQQAGYRVLLAADGTEAIARYAEHRREIQVVIVDAVMPFLDGVGLTRALRNLDPKIKVIGTSGNSDDQLVNELKALGLQAFITKPFDKHTFLTTLHQVLHETNP
ncbi:MAG: PAS domain S-box protein [Chthoniobacter sp.]|uniref:hybrid sensor histidine kinase/response regulator n=1 Tax=Chthoniobacter sp. TaxID=2510640 RepID=UPI0032A8E53D